MYRKTTLVFLIILSLTVVSCMEIGTQVVDWMNLEEGETHISGKYHILEEDGARVFLPESFDRYSLAEYQEVLRKKLPPAQASAQITSINKKMQMDGKMYIYFDELSGATFLVYSLPYTELSKSDARQALGIMRIQNENALAPGTSYEKVTAKYVGYPTNYIFKSVYRIASEEDDFQYFNSVYFVTRQGKTFGFQLTTGVGVFFDPYIEKLDL
ncbi:hypothetical protein [Aequorivita echinoideorum]|uniref:Lipoprotein n=1 Tax=Aequorivita echinoideorum TaxID=1549647 RepID=A0ABS5SBD2_9FLAO|nr:hypothetical protein [Aequorivita echinoideorum]MBT0609175.1 hypothetical protein [Aequorivita echinoideorum]